MSLVLSRYRSSNPIECKRKIPSMNQPRREFPDENGHDPSLSSHQKRPTMLQQQQQQQQQKQQLPKGQTHPTPMVSRGKSLLPTNRLHNKRRKTRTSQSLAPPQRITRKRRRCLPFSRPATTTVTTTTTTTTTRIPNEATQPIKNNFPGKLFRLVESCTSKSRICRQNQTKNEEILSWMAAPSDRHTNQTSDSATTAIGHCHKQKGMLLSLVVWDKDRFLDHHLARASFGSQSTFRSFERQLNSWGFKRHLDLERDLLATIATSSSTTTRCTPPEDNNKQSDVIPAFCKEGLRVFHHPFFQRGKPWLLKSIQRRKQNRGKKEPILKTVSSLAQSSVATEPKTKTNGNNGPPLLQSVENGSRFDENPRVVPTSAATASAAATAATCSDPSRSSCNTSADETSSSEDDDIHCEEEQQPPSIRKDVVLPSGICLRINQRIPTWAIPAQQAAIRYLYERHSNRVHTKHNNNEQNCTESSLRLSDSGPNKTILLGEDRATRTTSRCCCCCCCSHGYSRIPNTFQNPPTTLVGAVHHDTESSNVNLALRRQVKRFQYFHRRCGEDSIGSLLQSSLPRMTATAQREHSDSDDGTNHNDARFGDASEEEDSDRNDNFLGDSYNDDETHLTRTESAKEQKSRKNETSDQGTRGRKEEEEEEEEEDCLLI